MFDKKSLLLVTLALFVFTTLFNGGCTRKPQSNTLVEESFSTAPITTKVSKDLSKHLKEFSEFQDYSKYFSNLNAFYALKCYDNIALVSAGTEIAPKEHPQAIVHYSNLYIINLKSHKLIKTITYDKEKGFTGVYPCGINDDWIVYEEDDDAEFNPNFAYYAINRSTNEVKKLIERKRGHDEFFTQGENIPKGMGLWIAPPTVTLVGNKFYFKIYLTGDRVDTMGGLPVISDSIYEIDLNTGNIKKIIHITEEHGGIPSWSANEHYIAYCFAKRDFEKKTLIEDIYLYSLKDGKVSKLTDNGVSEKPRLTKDNWIIYEVWLPEALSLDPEVFDKSMGKPAFYNVIRPVNKEKPILEVHVGEDDENYYDKPACINVSPGGRFVLFKEPLRLLDRKTNTLITLNGLSENMFDLFSCFADDNTLINFGSIEGDQRGISIIDMSKLLQLAN